MKVGIKGYYETIVTKENVATAMKSGAVDVFATPMMIAGMEGAAADCVKPYLADGEATVGTHVNVSHLSATPIGMKVSFESELTEIDRKRLVFHVIARDEAGLIGEGTHERFIINTEKFMSRAEAKKG